MLLLFQNQELRDLCWKSITLENPSPSPSTRPKNRATNRSPRTITRSPSPKRSCHHLQRIRPNPSDFFRRTCDYHPDTFQERNTHKKPCMHKSGDTSVRQRRKLFPIFETFFLNIIWKTINFFLPSSFLHIAKLNGRICGAKRSHSVFEQPNCYQSV